MERPTIHLYTLCKNEEEIIPFFLAYYESFVDKITVFDNGSIDNSNVLLSQHPKCEIIRFDTKGEMRDDILMLIKNSAWKESIGIADWVIVCDIDEFLYHRDLISYVNKCKKKGETICETEGYNMICDDYPKYDMSIIDQVKEGAYSKKFSKTILFDPNEIIELNARPGGHVVVPEGNVRIKKSNGLKLLHYKYLGGLERLANRWNTMGTTLSAINKENGWATNRADPGEIVKRWNLINIEKEVVVLDKMYQRFFDWFKRVVLRKKMTSKNNF